MAVNFPPSLPALRLIATSAAAAVKTLPDRHTQSDSAGLRRRPVESARFIGRRCACAAPQSSQSSSRTPPCKQTDPDPQQQDAARMDFSTLLICTTAIVLVSQSSATRGWCCSPPPFSSKLLWVLLLLLLLLKFSLLFGRWPTICAPFWFGVPSAQEVLLHSSSLGTLELS